ncbi:helix-turn-helix domain-containing protein [Thalassoroseus pseudoceratinae]|uniref:helix-turn-helix domain-containing protein n=1 Tax=Thalassoroseus pseudoceratinae TaxID=2713176 RepID=UPI00141F8215|nr:XRE family transcriptional regulator [Thalassoroseus pseudoceratinae]
MTEPVPPDDIQNHLCQRVRELRKDRGWSLDALSAACGVSRSMLSQIERGQANPTLAVTARIARAFEMSIGELIETPEASSKISVIRAEDRQYHYRSDEFCTIRTLSPLHLEKDVEFYQVTFRSGGELKSAAHFEGTREFLTVEKGRVRVISAGDTIELSKGDSASYRADVPHAIENAGRSEAVIFLVDIYRSG